MSRQAVDDFARRRAEPDRARAGLAVAQEQTATLHVLPLEGEDFTVAAASQQEQRDNRAS
jgi:hypothetical protein